MAEQQKFLTEGELALLAGHISLLGAQALQALGDLSDRLTPEIAPSVREADDTIKSELYSTANKLIRLIDGLSISVDPSTANVDNKEIDKVNYGPPLLPKSARKWLSSIAEFTDIENIDELTTEDVEGLLDSLSARFSNVEVKKKNLTLTTRDIVSARLCNESVKDVADELGISTPVIYASLKRFKTEVSSSDKSPNPEPEESRGDASLDDETQGINNPIVDVSESYPARKRFTPGKLDVPQKAPTPAEVYASAKKEDKSNSSDLRSIFNTGIDSPNYMKTEEWNLMAEDYLGVLAEKHNFTEDETSDLLDHLGLGTYNTPKSEKLGSYRSSALNKLGKLYTERSKTRLLQNGMIIENVGVRALTTAVPGSDRSLDTVTNIMRKSSVFKKKYLNKATNEIARRHVIRGVAEILRDDE